jgi:hypothetical protein
MSECREEAGGSYEVEVRLLFVRQYHDGCDWRWPLYECVYLSSSIYLSPRVRAGLLVMAEAVETQAVAGSWLGPSFLPCCLAASPRLIAFSPQATPWFDRALVAIFRARLGLAATVEVGSPGRKLGAK